MDTQTLIFARELGQLQALRRAYEHLVPVALDLSMPQAPVNVVRTATVLFTDIRHFTGITERLMADPLQLLALVNEHVEVVVGAITRCGGVVEKFVGDGVFASFGARMDMPDHRERATAAAFGVIAANEALNRRRSAEWGMRLNVGVGAAAGKVVVGRIGPHARSELGLLGDPINVAARLVAQANAGEVLLEESVYQGMDQTLGAESLGQITVRGRSGPVVVHRIRVVPEYPSAPASAQELDRAA